MDFVSSHYRYPFVKKKVLNYSQLHLSKVTSYKIHTLENNPVLYKLNVQKVRNGENLISYYYEKKMLGINAQMLEAWWFLS